MAAHLWVGLLTGLMVMQGVEAPEGVRTPEDVGPPGGVQTPENVGPPGGVAPPKEVGPPEQLHTAETVTGKMRQRLEAVQSLAARYTVTTFAANSIEAVSLSLTADQPAT